MCFGAFRADLGGSLALLTGSWGLLGCFWGLLGCSWGLLEPLGALLGGSWGLLGASWAVLEAIQNNKHITCQKRSPRGGVIRFILEGLGGPKSTKIGPKTSQNLRRFSRPKKLRFKTHLEPSWADLEAFWRPSWGSNLRSGTRGRVFGEKSRF